MTDKKSALPYASQYPQQEPGMIKHLLLEAGMEVNDDFKEPTDHRRFIWNYSAIYIFHWVNRSNNGE